MTHAIAKLNQFVELWPQLNEQAKQELLTLANRIMDEAGQRFSHGNRIDD
jgi:hypothetical protein